MSEMLFETLCYVAWRISFVIVLIAILGFLTGYLVGRPND